MAGVPGGIPFRSMWALSMYFRVQAAVDIMSRDEAITYLRYLHIPEAEEGVNKKVSIIVNTLRDNCLSNFRPGPVRLLLLLIVLVIHPPRFSMLCILTTARWR